MDEPGSLDIHTLLTDEQETSIVAISSQLAYVETHAALARGEMTARLSHPARVAAQGEFERLWAQFAIVTIDDNVIERAAALAVEHCLRAYDAVHLSSALWVGGRSARTFVCYDRELRGAAAREGLSLLPTEI